MRTLTQLLVLIIALLHFWFLVLEMFLWTKPIGLKTFRLTPEFARASKSLAANQGLYNGFLAAGLLWGLIKGDAGRHVQMFFLSCVVVAGIYGAYSVSRKILFVQALPAGVAVLMLLLQSVA
jgi:putative membrane protein